MCISRLLIHISCIAFAVQGQVVGHTCEEASETDETTLLFLRSAISSRNVVPSALARTKYFFDCEENASVVVRVPHTSDPMFFSIDASSPEQMNALGTSATSKSVKVGRGGHTLALSGFSHLPDASSLQLGTNACQFRAPEEEPSRSNFNEPSVIFAMAGFRPDIPMLVSVPDTTGVFLLLIPLVGLVAIGIFGFFLFEQFWPAKEQEKKGPRKPVPAGTGPLASTHSIQRVTGPLDSVVASARTLHSAPPVNPRFLCPELVVPTGSECVLLMPNLYTTLQGQVVMEDIFDRNGVALLKVGVTCTPTGSTSQTACSEYVLLSRLNEQELTFCEITIPKSNEGGQFVKGSIYHWNGNLHATLVEENNETSAGHRSFIINVEGNSSLRVSGNFMQRTVQVMEVLTEKIVAEVAPSPNPGKDYKLVMQPNADSGLVIISLLAIDRILDPSWDSTVYARNSVMSARPSIMGRPSVMGRPSMMGRPSFIGRPSMHGRQY
uniref:Uncharacterized protein n=1 Tax=Noctiluca scintillans TaxID=2966 RepID=A0A7S1F5J9_NOCSC|mmetsp:Transcript_34265/g.91508  ORF Transcript_34265/g.91508 Transcript_34265/m.91508 type:complete len:494 (+) Transcript_34265:47-1528(+)